MSKTLKQFIAENALTTQLDENIFTDFANHQKNKKAHERITGEFDSRRGPLIGNLDWYGRKSDEKTAAQRRIKNFSNNVPDSNFVRVLPPEPHHQAGHSYVVIGHKEKKDFFHADSEPYETMGRNRDGKRVKRMVSGPSRFHPRDTETKPHLEDGKTWAAHVENHLRKKGIPFSGSAQVIDETDSDRFLSGLGSIPLGKTSYPDTPGLATIVRIPHEHLEKHLKGIAEQVTESEKPFIAVKLIPGRTKYKVIQSTHPDIARVGEELSDTDYDELEAAHPHDIHFENRSKRRSGPGSKSGKAQRKR